MKVSGRAKLTEAFLWALKPPAAGRLEVAANVTVGLLLRMTLNGVLSWTVRASRKGQRRRVLFSHDPALSLSEASHPRGRCSPPWRAANHRRRLRAHPLSNRPCLPKRLLPNGGESG